MAQCCTDIDFERYHQHTMGAEESARVDRHLKKCRHCRQRYAEFLANHELLPHLREIMHEFKEPNSGL